MSIHSEAMCYKLYKARYVLPECAKCSALEYILNTYIYAYISILRSQTTWKFIQLSVFLIHYLTRLYVEYIE
jgi:hypothetical protein